MDLYTVIFLNPNNGNRFLIEGCYAEVEIENDFSNIQSQNNPYHSRHFKAKKSSPTHLDIVLEIPNVSHQQMEELQEQTLHQELLLWFKDTHPNLIKGFVKGITLDSQKATINFKGNTTDKSYTDYITEVSNELNAEQFYWKNKTDHGSEPKITSKKRKEKTKVLKRKLTFK